MVCTLLSGDSVSRRLSRSKGWECGAYGPTLSALSVETVRFPLDRAVSRPYNESAHTPALLCLEVNEVNGFLVVGRCEMDDIPMQLCDTEKEARDFLSCVTPEAIISAALNVYGVDASNIITIDIVEFQDGKPLPIQF